MTASETLQSAASPAAPRAGERLAAALACAVLALVWVLPVSMESSWGYDETMHAELPALRMALSLREGEVGAAYGALLDCERYPFAYPVVLAAVQLVTGPSELACRVTGRALWALACFALFLLARAAAPPPARGSALAPWLALGLAATSPLALAFSGSLFLEIPFVLAASFAMLAWVRRDGSAGRDFAAGALASLAFFTKFNYGALLGAALALDLGIEALAAARSGRAAASVRSSLRVAAVPSLALLWWFVLARGAGHRAAFLDFMTENTDPGMAVGWDWRAVNWGTFFALSPVALLVVAVGALASLTYLRAAAVRTLWLVALVVVGALSWHAFHQERFLLAAGPPFWCLAGIGLARLLPLGARARAASLGALVVLVALTVEPTATWLARTAGFPTDNPYVLGELAKRRSLSGARTVPGSLRRHEAEELLDLVHSAVGPDDRIGWLGISEDLSRCALHAGLLARGGSRGRFLRDAPLVMFVETAQTDPGLGAEELAAWAEPFDVVVHSTPVDLGDRPGRRFMQRYVDLLHADGAWTCRELGVVAIQDANGVAHPVGLHACRRTP